MMDKNNNNDISQSTTNDLKTLGKVGKNSIDLGIDIGKGIHKGIQKQKGREKEPINNGEGEKPSLKIPNEKVIAKTTASSPVSNIPSQESSNGGKIANSVKGANRLQGSNKIADAIKKDKTLSSESNNNPIQPNITKGVSQKGQNEGAKKEQGKSNGIKEKLRKAREKRAEKKKKKIKRKLRRLRRKLIIWAVSTTCSMLMSIALFLIANPAILGIILLLQFADNFAELWSEAMNYTLQANMAGSAGTMNAWNNFISLFTGEEPELIDPVEYGKSVTQDDEITVAEETPPVNPEDEYYDSLMKSYDLCQVIAEDTWGYIYSEASTMADEGGYDGWFFDHFTIVNKNGKEVTGWEDIFFTESEPGMHDGVNWGDFIIAMDLCFTEETYGTEGDGDKQMPTYDPNDLLDWINSDTEHLKCLYTMQLVEVEDGEATIIVYPYDYESLYRMGKMYHEDRNITLNDDYGSVSTYIDASQVKLQQMREVLATEEPYNTLGLFNETNIQNNGNNVEINDLATGNVEVDNLEGNSTEEKLWHALKDDGYSDIGAAGLMGNIKWEHGYKTGYNDSSHNTLGMAQWEGGRLADLVSYAIPFENKDETDPDVQIAYLVNVDFPRRMAGAYDGTSKATLVKEATDLKFATDLVCAYFETPSAYRDKDDWIARNGKYDWSRYAKTDVHFTYKGKSWWYWIDLDKRRKCAEEVYAKYHTE